MVISELFNDSEDDVKSYFNISKNFTDIVNNEVKDYKTNNVTVQNSVIELTPSMVIDGGLGSDSTGGGSFIEGLCGSTSPGSVCLNGRGPVGGQPNSLLTAPIVR